MATDFAEPSFTTLAEEFLRRRRTGAASSVEEFAKEFPHLREVILNEFPALIVAESLKDKECTVRLPDTLGRYKVGQEIGRGAMGIVVAGTNPDLESEIAIKLLPFERIRSIEMLQRFHAEAKLCASIDHPNIVPVFDYGTDDNFAYLVMRKVAGNSLDIVMAELAKHSVASDSGGIDLDWNFITSIGIQAAEALHYAHCQGVIHRDIKPANLILEEEGRLWVTDFGLSKVLSSDLHLSMTGDIVGTPRYMAPEQLRGVYNARSDVYSLGMTLYELLAVKSVWDPSMSTTELLAGKQTLVLPDLKELNPAVPNALCEVVMQAVELRPEDRFATANDLSIALKQSVTGTFIGDRRRKDRETIRRNRVRNIGVAVCMGLLASACVYFLAPSQEEIFENALQDEIKIREILNREASKQALVDQFPQLMDQFLSADDKETRLAFGNFAESLMNSAASSSGRYENKEEKEWALKGWRRLKDAYVEHGLNDRDAIAATNLPEDYPIVHVVRRQYEQWSRDVQAMPFSDQWKEHAQKQLSRYRASAEDSSLEILVESQIHTMLRILPTETVEGRVEPRLTAESLRFLISFLETKLDESVLASSKTKNSASISSASSRSKRSLPKSSDIGNVIDQLEQDEQVSELIGEVLSDGRFSELLEKVKKAEKN